MGASPEAAAGPRRGGAEMHTHHGAWRQGGPLPVVVAVGELQVEQQGAVRGRVQAVRVHQHLQAQAAVPVKSRGVHHAYGENPETSNTTPGKTRLTSGLPLTESHEPIPGKEHLVGYLCKATTASKE